MLLGMSIILWVLIAVGSLLGVGLVVVIGLAWTWASAMDEISRPE